MSTSEKDISDNGGKADTEGRTVKHSAEKEKELWEKGRRRHEMCKHELMAGDDNYKVCREEKVA